MRMFFLGLAVLSVLGPGCAGDKGSENAETGSIPAECQPPTNAATEFIQENNSCETLLDCVQVDAICYDGPLDGPCGAVGVSADADLNTWAQITTDLEGSCECGAAACGSEVMCSDQGACVSFLSSEDYCPSVLRDIQTFLAAHRSCQTDADCQLLGSTCYVDNCHEVSVNLSANAADWKRLDDALRACDDEPSDPASYCNVVGNCGFPAVCNAQGQCTA